MPHRISTAPLNDPIWFHTISQRVEPFIPYVRNWWDHVEELDVSTTGIYHIPMHDADQRLYYRFTKSPKKSPIRGIQAFPFILAATLQIVGVDGGSTKLIQVLLNRENNFIVDEFQLIEIHNLPSTFNQGQLIAFIPVEYMDEKTSLLGSWLYVNHEESKEMLHSRQVPETFYNKLVLRG